MKRRSGVLLHITSLPSEHGIGNLGSQAYRFADLLEESNQRLWQVLPLVPVDGTHGCSPYSSTTAFAGNPLLIDPEMLVSAGLIERRDSGGEGVPESQFVDYEAVHAWMQRILDKAWHGFGRCDDPELECFVSENQGWLEDFVLFRALRQKYGTYRWDRWPPEIRNRHPDALERAREELDDSIRKQRFIQFQFFSQWMRLKRYCNRLGVQVIGDIPMYVNYGSADVWSHREYFKLGHDQLPSVVAGVPPDYFSATGQRWGNPVYDWDRLRDDGFGWWVQRVQHALRLYDFVRIDHFRGFLAGWEIPVSAHDATQGQWISGPGEEFFHALFRGLPHLPIIAEDLGTITPDVRELMRRYGIPGMKVLLFAFSGNTAYHPYVPHNHSPDSVVYVGNHDTNTARGWFEEDASPSEKRHFFEYVGRQLPSNRVAHELVRMAEMSVAETAIIPMQDILNLGSQSRMNRPGGSGPNWQWRMQRRDTHSAELRCLKEMSTAYGRA